MSSFKLAGESASGGDVVGLCEGRVSGLTLASLPRPQGPHTPHRPLATLGRGGPVPRDWSAMATHPSSPPDASPSMRMSEEVAARMDFWTDICGGGCMYGSGLDTIF